MRHFYFAIVVAIASRAHAALNGSCNPDGLGSKYGVCISTGSCRDGGGTSTNGDCPWDPDGIKCCYEMYCKGDDGICMWADDCKNDGGKSLTGKNLGFPCKCALGGIFGSIGKLNWGDAVFRIMPRPVELQVLYLGLRSGENDI